MTDSTFYISESVFNDVSSVFDVYLSDSNGKTLVAYAPSRKAAEELAYSLNVLRDRILECESDRAVSEFSAKFKRFMLANVATK